MTSIALEVIKWVLIVLIAGFIGYFGKYLAMYTIRKVKKEKQKTTENKKEPTNYDYKLEKKRLKLEKKKLKS